ncbi:MAG: phosphoribosylanthranilate isomerase [Gammaproteobacteria bacterium]|nr:phosphoribosylanthranilate isomerase [Gammaproteobacteria bacterium]
MRTRLKICGITRCEDAQAAAQAGADAIGLVFYPPSPRAVTISQAAEIVAALPPFVTTVALFVNPTPNEVAAVLASVAIDLLQFHGSESPQFCASFSRPYLKALRVAAGVDIVAEAAPYCQDACRAQAILLDTLESGSAGGTGQAFDWQLIPPALRKSIILAGGLRPESVAGAILQLRPYGVDVSSGVESAKGIKDFDRIAQFSQQVREADAKHE